jgi:hypothetical protein
MDQRSIIIKPIHTPDFIITTEKKGWRVSQKLFFQIHGKTLKACPTLDQSSVFLLVTIKIFQRHFLQNK